MSSGDQPGSRPPRTFGRPPDPTRFAPPAEPVAAPTTPPRRVRPSTVGIIALVTLMVVSLAVIPFVAPAVDRLLEQRQPDQPEIGGPSQPGTPLDPGGPRKGGSGAGDPYFPNYGSSGFDALDYSIDLDWNPDQERLTGSTTVEARAAHELRSFYLDLVLPVTGVTVNGEPAEVSREGFYDILITPADPIDADSMFTVTVDYAGRPGAVNFGGYSPWQISGEEAIIAGEPESAAWWYAASDHPSDPATFEVTVRVPAGWEAISNGELISPDVAQEEDFDSWRWRLDETASTYQAFVAIGQYELRTGTADGRPYGYAVSEQLDEAAREHAFEVLATTPDIIEDLEGLIGPYPYSEIGGVVPAHRLWFAGLETATRPIYAAETIAEEDPSHLLIHELAHAWFGNRVTMEQWNDIFINEAYASYAEWAVAELNGRGSAQDRLQRSYQQLQGDADFWRVTMHNPGREHLFDSVYSRGPMTLQALKNVIGQEAFDRLTEQWAARRGPHSLEDWMDAAQRTTSTDLQPFFDAWIYGQQAPARTAENGLA